MIKREALFTVLFRHWVFSHIQKYALQSCAFELKQTQKDYINFHEIKDHQIDALLAVKHGEKGLLWKLPDDSRGIKPFDMFYLYKANAYLVIKYPGFFCVIDIDAFITFRDKNKNKIGSLNTSAAKQIATIIVPLE